MARVKQQNDRWPRAWINGKPHKDINVEKLARSVDEDDTFHLGQCYENTAAKTVECAKCGSREFNVGSGSYFTAIRCPKCGWEVCFHDG